MAPDLGATRSPGTFKISSGVSPGLCSGFIADSCNTGNLSWIATVRCWSMMILLACISLNLLDMYLHGLYLLKLQLQLQLQQVL